MFTASTLVIISIVGIAICMNPFRRKPTYGRRARASIRNLYTYQE